MNKTEAKKTMLNKQVQVYTASRGWYQGKLIEVKTPPGKPWRGVVLIDTVWADKLDRNVKKIGETIEAGGMNISLLFEQEQGELVKQGETNG